MNLEKRESLTRQQRWLWDTVNSLLDKGENAEIKRDKDKNLIVYAVNKKKYICKAE